MNETNPNPPPDKPNQYLAPFNKENVKPYISTFPPGADFSVEEALDILANVSVTEPQAKKAHARLVQRFEVQGPLDIQSVKDAILLGRYSRLAGVRDLIRGICLEVQRMCFIYMQKNDRDAEAALKDRLKNKHQIVMAYRNHTTALLEVLVKTCKALLDAEGSLAALPASTQNPETPTAASFAPGQNISPPSSGTLVVAQQVHMHQQQPDKPETPK